MQLEWLKTGIGPLKDLLTFLSKEGKTNDILKKQVLRELRNNLNLFHNAYKNNVAADIMIDMLSNEPEAARELQAAMCDAAGWFRSVAELVDAALARSAVAAATNLTESFDRHGCRI